MQVSLSIFMMPFMLCVHSQKYTCTCTVPITNNDNGFTMAIARTLTASLGTFLNDVSASGMRRERERERERDIT